MEKRSFDERDSKRVKVVKEFVPKTVRIVLSRNKKVTTVGSVTGNTYVFPKAGSILDIDERDAPTLLAKGAGGTSCCSGQPSSPYFRLETQEVFYG